MMHVKIDGKKLQIPSRLSEVTFRQLQSIYEAKDNFDLLQAITGISATAWKNCKDVDGFNMIVANIQKLISDKGDAKKILHVGDKTYTIPDTFDIGEATLAQYEDVKKDILSIMPQEEDQQLQDKDLLKIAPHLVAVYVQGIDEEYDYKKASKLEEKILDCSATEVLALATFFLISALAYYSGIQKTQLMSLLHQKKGKPGIRSSQSSSGFWRRLTRFRGAIY